MPGKTLVIGTEPRVIVAVARSLRRHGVAVHAGTFPPEAVKCRSRAIERIVALPDADTPDDELSRKFRTLILEQNYDTIFPCSDTALRVMARVYGELCTVVKIACPT